MIIAATLTKYVPTRVIRFLSQNGARVRALKRGERYAEVSPALARMGFDVDGWPAPPAGLFVVDERTVYVRSRSAMTLVHECGHAADCCLGGGVYPSGTDATLRRLFTNAKQFVTRYAATSIDEYFAEAFRAMMEANDPASHWPRVSKARLKRADPDMYKYMSDVLAEIAAKFVGQQLDLGLVS